MKAVNAWLIRRPVANGLIAGVAAYAGYLAALVCMGKWHGWLAPLPYAVFVVVVIALFGYIRKSTGAEHPA